MGTDPTVVLPSGFFSTNNRYDSLERLDMSDTQNDFLDFNTFAGPFVETLSGYMERSTIAMQGGAVFQILSGLFQGAGDDEDPQASEGAIFLHTIMVINLFTIFCIEQGGLDRWLATFDPVVRQILEEVNRFKETNPGHAITRVESDEMLETWITNFNARFEQDPSELQ